MGALSSVQDPEIRRPITEIGMVKNVSVEGKNVQVDIYLTVEGCPLRQEIVNRVTNAVKKINEKGEIEINLDRHHPDSEKTTPELSPHELIKQILADERKTLSLLEDVEKLIQKEIPK